jgi:hypothetical protein
MKKILLVIFSVLSINTIFAQNISEVDAFKLLQQNSIELGLNATDLNNSIISDAYNNNYSNLQMVYVQQSHLGLPIYNQIQTLAFKSGKLVSKAGSRISGIEKRTLGNNGIPSIDATAAVLSAMRDRKISTSRNLDIIKIEKNGHKVFFDKMNVSRENITAELIWVPVEDGKKLVLCWQVYLIPTDASDYWMVRVNANDNSIVGIDNYTVTCNWGEPEIDIFHLNEHPKNDIFSLENIASSSSKSNLLENSPSIVNTVTYRVIPYPAESPQHTGGAHAVVTNPWSLTAGNATTLKWHNNGTLDFNYTRGNNVWAQEDRNGNNGTGIPANSTTPSDPLAFEFTPNYTVTPTQTSPVPNQQFNTTNLFYWNNIIHDLSYQYGFDEVSGNFQASNLGRGGAENDYVLADAQDGSGTNNANFATPADGGSGRMQMYLWGNGVQKDGDVDNGIISHEFAHGISNRLTGGPSQAGCLQNTEQMGEGWSDYYSLMYTQNWATSTLTTGFSTPRSIGTYASGQSASSVGIRSQRYCTNFNVNNKVYAATIPTAVHDRGEIWCAALWDMTWNIINQVGFINPNLFDTVNQGGNSIALRLVTEGMKLQPCSPGFIDARNGILEADQILYGGAHLCAIWEAFRRRGMGAFASQGSSGSVTDQVADFTVGTATLRLSQSVQQVLEGDNVTYTNTITTDNCGGITNFLLTDTLPTNVTYVSGGTYNAGNRVVSFTVTQAAGQTQQYSFTVRTNPGSYFPTLSLFEDSANGPGTSPYWTTTSTTTGNWIVSNARSFSPTKSYFSTNLDVQSDQSLVLTNAIALGATPPPLTFRHWFNCESTYDGGVLEASTDGGTTWNDMQPNFLKGGYIATMDATTLLNGRRAWTGSSDNKFIKTKVNLTPYANQNIKIRFRFTTDVGTNLEGWYVDDIAFKNQAVVEIQSNLFGSNGIRVGITDTFTIITPQNTCVAAAVGTPPSDVTACVGGDITFTPTITGTNPTYQWQVSNDGGLTFNNISGATNATYTINNAGLGISGNKYRVIVTNDCPSTAISLSATLTVTNPPNIVSEPIAQTICAGGNVSFVAQTSGTVQSYQWQVSADGGTTFTNIQGANSAILNLSNVTSSMNNQLFHLNVLGCGTTPVVSSNVSLTVNPIATIVSQPSNATVCLGNNASLNVSATGTNLTYQWQMSTDGGVSFNDILGATNATVTINNVTTAMNNYQYHVIVNSTTCPSATISSNAVLTINNGPSISAQPTSTAVCVGKNVTITASSTDAGVTYQWQVSTDGGTVFNNVSGETSSSIVLNNVTSSMNNNKYRVVVANVCNSINSNVATLTVNQLPLISISASPSTVIFPGQNISLTASANSSVSTYSWYNNGTLVTGQNSSTINVTSASVGNYSVSVVDLNGCINSSENINVRDTILTYTFIFPNPNNGKFKVRFEGVPYNALPRIITIYDAKGARVYKQSFVVTASYQIMDVDASHLSSGVYALALSDVNGEILETGKVVIQ